MSPEDTELDTGTPVDDDVATRETVRLPIQRRPPEGAVRRGAPLLVAAVVAAFWAAVLTVVPLMLLMTLAGLGSGWRSGLLAWLLGQGVPLATPTDQVSLTPLTITAFCAWRLLKAGVHTGRAIGALRRRRLRRGIASAVAVGLAYAGLGALAAALADTPRLHVSPGRAALTLGLFAAVCALIGVLLRSKAGRVRWRRLPPLVTDAIRTGVVAALLVTAAGAGTVGIALAIRAGEATDMLGSFRAGVLGQAGIIAVCLAFAPNLAAWAAGYLLGPGFAVGVGTKISNTAVIMPTPLPGLPVTAGLPDSPASGFTAALLLGVPVVAAMASGWLLTRRKARLATGELGNPASAEPLTWSAVAGPAALAGPVAGILLGLLAWASSGGLGSNRLAELGPEPWRVGVFAAGVVALGAFIGAVASANLVTRRQ